MGAYIQSILVASVAAGIITALAPGDDKSGTGKYIRYTVSLAVIIVIATPFASFMTKLTELPERFASYAERFKTEYSSQSAADTVIGKSRENIESSVEAALMQKYAINKEEVKCEVRLDTSDHGNIIIQKVTVTLYGRAAWLDTKLVCDYVREITASPAEVYSG